MVLIDDIAIRIMLDHEPIQVKPVVEDLAAFDVATDAPECLVAFRREILVADELCVDVLHFKRGVVRSSRDRRAERLCEEERVVI